MSHHHWHRGANKVLAKKALPVLGLRPLILSPRGVPGLSRYPPDRTFRAPGALPNRRGSTVNASRRCLTIVNNFRFNCQGSRACSLLITEVDVRSIHFNYV